MQVEILYVIVAVFCLFNLLVSVYIFKRDDLELFQKVVQTILVWLIPVLAGIGLWLFHRSNDEAIKPITGVGNYAKDDKAYTGTGNYGGD
ncbi:hypothetical protein SG34_007460 [Thalassomonas viridans]|uniref:Uncharacterized protein n=1 Tax=Thalassomonas viridans TaxID=137584 RepID=A0AAF0C8S1_9GAMM|nr:hypothetical protein [Thalassomonas viridans]WDE06732.1 hypothetical protein SG34_007460 [Thalassomonas viridans]